MHRSTDKYLVDYNLGPHKIGYLVASRLDDAVLIESFLFLTMDGTPEGTALWKKLRLSRMDKEHLGLDRIHTFLMTDIQHDPSLFAILNECGCGHLFRIVKELPRDQYLPGYANELRRYLGIQSPPICPDAIYGQS